MKPHRITALCIMLAMLVVVMPAIKTEAMESRMTYILSHSADLYISDSGEASITGYVRGKGDVTSTYVRVALQRKSGNYWIDVESWEDSGTERNLSVVETYSVSGACLKNHFPGLHAPEKAFFKHALEELIVLWLQ